MQPFKFVHAADLHLDSPFTGLKNKSPKLSGLMLEATFRAFERIVDLCLEERVDFLLVAGDIYDGADRSILAQLRFQKGLQRLAGQGIAAFVAHGNHDPLDGWSSSLAWPEKVHIFPGGRVESVPFVKDGLEAARIYGTSFPRSEVRENLVAGFRRDRDVPFAVGLVHCNLGANTGHEPYAPCTLADLEKSGFDYWALGHVHTRAEYRIGDRVRAVYPGNPQGRHPGEKGARGAVLVEVDSSGEIATRFVPVDLVRWDLAGLEISGLAHEQDLNDALERLMQERRAAAENRYLCLRVALRGRGPLHSVLRSPGYLADLEAGLQQLWSERDIPVWLERLEDRTGPAIDVEARRRADDFLAGLLEEFSRAAQNLPVSLKELEQVLEPLFERRMAGRYIPVPQEQTFKELLEAAETLCLDRLIADSED